MDNSYNKREVLSTSVVT